MSTSKTKRVRLIEDEDDLTPKQRKFVAEFAIDQNQTQAAIRAGFSKRSAPVLAHRLLKNVNVVKAIQRATAKRLKRVDVTADRVIEELAAVGFSETKPSLPKPSDKIAALQTLAKHLGLLVERREVTGQMNILNLNVSQADLESARALVESFKSEPPPLIEGEVEKDDDAAK